MRVVRLTAENVKRLVAVDITPQGDVIVVGGQNGMGKSSLLDSLWMTISARAASVADPIRHGQSKAEVTVDLGELVVTRTWKGAKSTLVVKTAAGAQVQSPQTLLDSLIGKLSFDPLAFAQAKPDDQRAMLLSVVDLGFDLAELAAQRKAIYDERTDVGRDLKSAKARFDAAPLVPKPSQAPVDIAEAMENLTFATSYSHLLEYQARVEEGIAKLQRDLESVKSDLRSEEARAEESGWTTSVEVVSKAIAEADQINQAHKDIERRAELAEESNHFEAQWKEQGERLARLDTWKAEQLGKAKMPIPGLALDSEDQVTYNGVVFSQASAAERLRTSVAIAMAANPKLRVIRITDGSLLDDSNMAVIREMCAEHDMQCWLEVVGERDDVQVLIEEGRVVEKGDSRA